MRLYWSAKQIPGIRDLPRKQRRRTIQHYEDRWARTAGFWIFVLLWGAAAGIALDKTNIPTDSLPARIAVKGVVIVLCWLVVLPVHASAIASMIRREGPDLDSEQTGPARPVGIEESASKIPTDNSQ